MNTTHLKLVCGVKLGYKSKIIQESILYSLSKPNNGIASWLLNLMSEEISASVIYSNSATTIWSDLQECFRKQNI